MWKLAGLTALLCLSVCAQERVIYVSTNGNDAWNGSALIKPGVSGPFLTLGRALAAARQSGGGAKIVLGPGRHALAEPITLTEQDSGTADHPLVITAAPKAKPVLSGGRPITGWQQDPQNPRIWTADLPDVRAGKWQFRQLLINGQRKTRARTPNHGYLRIQGASPQDKPVKLHFKPGDIKREWAERGDVEVIALLAWADIRMQIRAVDETNHVATLSGEPRPSNQEANAQYWLENAPEFLDSPGEWYLDVRAGRLSYWPEEGEDMRTAQVVAPALKDLVILKGQPGQPVRHVRFEGIEFAHTDWTLPPNGYADTQAAVATRGDVRAEFAEDVTVENCRFAHLAGYGLELARGCKGFAVVGNEFVDLGGGGIRVGETAHPRSAAEENNSHRITDNEIHHLGRVYAPAVGIFILQSGTNRVAHNHIYDLYYTAISVGWNWGYQETPCRENLIEFNHLHDIGQNVLSDMGAIYTLGIQHGTVLRNNLIHDVSAFTYGGWGLYPDEGSTGILLENNVVYRCKSAGFHQHYGRENVVRNNIFAFDREHQLMRTREEAHTSFIFTNNIVYFDSGSLLGSNWSNDHFVMDYNLYYDARLAANPAGLKFGNASLAQWQARGHDAHSLAADPLFVAPDKMDFRLKPESPALKLGFKPIDLSTVGVRPANAR